jgi:hypothetical protein
MMAMIHAATGSTTAYYGVDLEAFRADLHGLA